MSRPCENSSDRLAEPRRERHHSRVQEVAGFGSWERDLTNERLYWSAGLKGLLDISPEQALSTDRFLEAIHPADSERFRDAWEQVSDGDPFDIEHRLLSVSGETRWVRHQTTIEYADDGSPSTAFGVVQDITARQDRQRRAGDRRFQSLFEHFSQPTVELEYRDGAPIVERVNTAFEDTFGYETETIVGESLDSFIVPPDKQAEARAINDRVQRTGELVSEEVTRRTVNGDRQFILQNAVYDGGSKAFAVYTDITDKREKETQLQKAQAVADIGYWSKDIGSSEIYCSEQVREIWDLDRGVDSFDEDLYLESIHPDDRDDVVQQWQAATDGGSYDVEHRIVTASGDVKWIRVNADFECDDAGTPVSATGVVQDVTERKRRESRLERQAEAMSAAMDGIAILDSSGEYVYMNRAHAAIFGYDREELLGHSWHVLYGPDEKERFETTAFETVAETGEWRGEAIGRTRDGTTVHHEVTLSRLDDGGLICTNQDITGRKEREQQLQVLERVLRHNLRNDLQVIRGVAETIRTSASDDVAACAASIVEKSDALAVTAETEREITDLLLDTPKRQSVDVDALLTSLQGMIDADYPDAAVTVDCPDGARAVASTRLGRALEELVTNAIEHNDRDAPVVDVTVTRTAQRLQVEIADNGPPIPDREQQVCTRGATVDPLYHGNGLGLWLTYWIVTRSNGTVSFRDNHPRGNVVCVKLPRSRP